jgi:hypothetical protein
MPLSSRQTSRRLTTIAIVPRRSAACIARNAKLRLIDLVLNSSFGVEMIRTIWLAALFLAVICGLCASKVTASISPPEEGVPDRTTLSFVTDTLTKSDRLDIASLPLGPEVTFALPPDPVALFSGGSQPTPPAVRPHRPLKRVAKSKQLAKPGAVVLPKPRPKVKLLHPGPVRSASLH